MTKQELERSLQKAAKGKGCITCKELCEWLGLSNASRVKTKYLSGLEPIAGKKYFIPDVAKNLYERG